MATQVDSLSRGSFKAFRPWRRRDAAGHASQQDVSTDEDVSTALCQVSNVVKREQPSASQKENRRPRAELISCPPSSTSGSHGASRTPNDVANTARSPPESTAPPVDELVDLEPASDSSTALLSHSGPLPPTHGLKQPPSIMLSLPRGSDLPLPEVEQTSSSRLSLKRRRALSDVDGPNTAALCCKKRRLRRFLITSRLSQPFSQPATHILNRESVASGDKRFLKLAAIVNARRIVRMLSVSAPPSPQFLQSPHSPHSPQSPYSPQPPQPPAMVPAPHLPCPNEVLRRAAMANRFRKRIYADAASGRSIAGAPTQLMTNARFTIVPIATAASMTGVAPATAAATVASSAVFTAAGPVVGARLALKPAFAKPPLGGEAAQHGHPQLMGRMVGFVRNNGTGVNLQIIRPISRSPKLRPVRDHKAAPGGLNYQDISTLHHSTSSQANDGRPSSDDGDASEISVCFDGRSYGNDDDDEDDDREFAFPTSEHESRYESSDDPDDVYSDFSVLFSSTAEDADWDEDGLDDYMDELDGIAHLPR